MAKEKNNNQNKGTKIKVSHARIFLELEPAIRTIGDMKGIKDIDVTMNIVKTRKNVDVILDIFDKTRKKIIDGSSEKDKDGRPVTRQVVRKNPQSGDEVPVEIHVFKDEETEKQVNLQLRALDEKEVELEIFPVNYLKIKDCENLTPNILKAAGEFVIL